MFKKSQIFYILSDIILINLSLFFAFILRFGPEVPYEYSSNFIILFVFASITRLIVFLIFGSYRTIWKYAGLRDLLHLAEAIVIGSLLLVMVIFFNRNLSYPRLVIIIDFLLNLLLLLGYRIIPLYISYLKSRNTQKTSAKRTLIIGAGEAGTAVLREIEKSAASGYIPVGFIDDDSKKSGMHIHGVEVLGQTSEIVNIVKQLKVEQIVIAMPSAGASAIRSIIDTCSSLAHLGVKFKIVPGVTEIISGDVSISNIKDIDIEDLLEREPVDLDIENISHYIKKRTVLITGAGGSIGSELVRQITKFEPKAVLLLGKGENSIFNIEVELFDLIPLKKTLNFDIVPIIADIKDRQKMEQVFKKYKPEVVFHAAAHKHVPLMESNPDEAVKNNILGTKIVAELASKYKAERFVMISTDKVIRPKSVMGATKRIAELVIQLIAKVSRTRFMIVRFGNVLGSRGSVIPLFKKQIAKGGPVTVTHPDVERYFMTIEEAAKLVLQAGSMGNKGERFMLDMGKQVKIADLAKSLIKLSGFVPDVDIKIEYIGLRPGEKLYEELLIAEQGLKPSKHRKIFAAKPEKIDAKSAKNIEELIKLAQSKDLSDAKIKAKIKTILPEYSPEVSE